MIGLIFSGWFPASAQPRRGSRASRSGMSRAAPPSFKAVSELRARTRATHAQEGKHAHVGYL